MFADCFHCLRVQPFRFSCHPLECLLDVIGDIPQWRWLALLIRSDFLLLTGLLPGMMRYWLKVRVKSYEVLESFEVRGAISKSYIRWFRSIRDGVPPMLVRYRGMPSFPELRVQVCQHRYDSTKLPVIGCTRNISPSLGAQDRRLIRLKRRASLAVPHPTLPL